MTKKFSQDLNGPKNRIVGASSKLEEFLLSSQVLVQPRLIPRNSRDFSRENRKREKDVSHNEPHPEVDHTVSRSTRGDL